MHNIDRREFLKGSAATGVGLCLCGSGTGCAMVSGVGSTAAVSPQALTLNPGELVIDLAKVPELAKVGGSAKLIDRPDVPPLIIARTDEATYVAASIECTHGGREVEYSHNEQKLECVSFGHSAFALDGEKLGGPAKGPLPIYETRLEGKSLTIVLPA